MNNLFSTAMSKLAAAGVGVALGILKKVVMGGVVMLLGACAQNTDQVSSDLGRNDLTPASDQGSLDVVPPDRRIVHNWTKDGEYRRSLADGLRKGVSLWTAGATVSENESNSGRLWSEEGGADDFKGIKMDLAADLERADMMALNSSETGRGYEDNGAAKVVAGCLLDQTIKTLTVVVESGDDQREDVWSYSWEESGDLVAESSGDRADLVVDRMVVWLGDQDPRSVRLERSDGGALRADLQAYRGRSVSDISSLNVMLVLSQSEEGSGGGDRDGPGGDMSENSGVVDHVRRNLSHDDLKDMRLLGRIKLLVNGVEAYVVNRSAYQRSVVLSQEYHEELTAGEPGHEVLKAADGIAGAVKYVHTLDALALLRKALSAKSSRQAPRGGLSDREQVQMSRYLEGFFGERFVYERSCGRGGEYISRLAMSSVEDNE